MPDEKDIKNNGTEAEDMEKLKKERDEYLDGWKRAKADLINYKKEEAQRLENFAKFSNEVLIAELLTILDSFELGLSVVAENDPARKGMELIKSQLEETLRKNGLERIHVKRGDPLDTNLEEAVGEVNAAEPPGTIAEEISGGYKLHDKVIRPVRVKLSKGQ
ncbi:MAG: nucleotide exchange factor GrpE [Minisyncoccia bacterium]|jgi:molecular chaperone GrpE